MVKRWRLMFLTLMVILLSGSVVFAGNDITQEDINAGLKFCKEFPVSLQLDGKPITSDVPPVIIKERTMIPARAVFESMGGTVTWNEAARVVEVTLGTSKVTLTIDNKIAFVNGKQVPMEVPALIVQDRTLIPIRFVAESLSCNVGWNPDARIVLINSPVIADYTSVSSIKAENLSDKYRIIIQGDDVMEGYKSFAMDNPDRFCIDIKKAVLAADSISSTGISSENEIFNSVRYSQFESDTVRLVVDLKQKVVGKISLSDDKKSIYIDFDKNQAAQHENLGGVTADGLAVLDWRAAGRLVVIDPGHGGKDTGSQAIRDGVEILNEKDINLDVATRLNKMLKAAGVNTYMLREGDTSISLYGRPELANAANGDLYIAVHNNSFPENPNANGVETYYYSKPNESDYNIYSKKLAELAQQELVKELGLNNRGAKSEPAYAVLNKTKMPAIIIEGGFLSNTNDLKFMMTDEFRQKYAFAAAKAIIQVLNESVEQ